MSKISVIGAGQVGAATAFALAESGLAEEIIIVDLAMERATAAALDIAHGVPMMRPVQVRAGSYADCADSDFVVLTAGASQNPGEKRPELAGRNRTVVEAIVRDLKRFAPHCVLVVVTNPVDYLVKVAIQAGGFAPTRVIGSGTVLDSLRLRAMIAKHTGVDARDVQAAVLGEHGDSEVPAWSAVQIGGLTVTDFCRACGQCDEGLEGRLRADFDREVRNVAYEIIQGKGATNYGIAVAVRRIASAVLGNEHAVLTVSTLLNGEYGLRDVAVSLPCVVGARGIERVLPLELSAAELEALKKSAETVRAFKETAELQRV